MLLFSFGYNCDRSGTLSKSSILKFNANSAIARIFSISVSTLRGILKRHIGRSDRLKKSQIGSNAPPHTARITEQWLANNCFPVLDWIPYSPDLNPIEHVWGLANILKRSVALRRTNIKQISNLIGRRI